MFYKSCETSTNVSARYFAACRHLPPRAEPEGRRLAQVDLSPLQSRVVAPLRGGDVCRRRNAPRVPGERQSLSLQYVEGATESPRKRHVYCAGKESVVEVQAVRPLCVVGRAQGRHGHRRCSGILQVKSCLVIGGAESRNYVSRQFSLPKSFFLKPALFPVNLKMNLSFVDSELPTGQVCFKLGTDSSKVRSITEKSDHCPCKSNYFGEDCGIPEAAWFGHYKVNQ